MIKLEAPFEMVLSRHGWFIINTKDVYIGRSFQCYGEYNYDEWLMLQSIIMLSPGDVVEVGANIGSHSLPMAKLLSKSNYQIHLFEPQPMIFGQLCANLCINAINNAKFYQKACGDSLGQLFIPRLDIHINDNFGGVQVSDQPLDKRYESVETTTLDEELKNVKKIGLIKIDIEGFEYKALIGAKAVIQKHRPVLYVENDHVEKSPKLIELLQGLGYRLWWHMPRLFSAENYFSQQENIFQGTVSLNMLCVPVESTIPVVNLQEIFSPQEPHPLERFEKTALNA